MQEGMSHLRVGREVQHDYSSAETLPTAQSPNKFGRTSVVQERFSRIHPYPRHGPDEVSPQRHTSPQPVPPIHSDFFPFPLTSLRNINSIRPSNSTAIVSLFSAYSPSATASTKKPVDIVDPYYGNGMSGFERCYGQCMDYSNGFLDQVERGELESGDKVKKAGL